MGTKKKNGFVFIETIIVIAVLTTALVLLYSTFTAVLNQEKKRASFEDVAYLYRTYYLTEFYNDVAKRSMAYGIDDKNPIVSIPLTADAAKDFIPAEELGFYERLIGSSFGITNVYLAGDNIGDLEDCNSSKTSCDVLEDLAGSNWKTYLKTLYKNNSGYRMIGVYGTGENKYGSGCFDVFEGTLTSSDSTCNFYYSSLPIRGLYRDESKANVPELDNGLIPVKYEGNKWVKADPSKKWYDYNEQWWANAVTVSASSRSKYTSATFGTEIKMNDIETMWVWIPRYEYQHTNLSTQYAGTKSFLRPGGITINFISKNTTTPSSDNFTIHDAFWWDDNNDGKKVASEQLSGIWVAKFEMSTGSTNCTAVDYSIGNNCDLATIYPQIKPNVTSWRGARIGTMWTAIHNNMNGENNIYGITNSDTHLIKNMEWGAVAYLSQSKYGKYGNPSYEGTDKEIAINNCSNYITGIGGDTVRAKSSSTSCTKNTYETEKGQTASTTGNIYGIYDMSGGAYEYVMGVQATEADPLEPIIGGIARVSSGWSGILFENGNWAEYTGTYGSLGGKNGIGTKYYDIYTFSKDPTIIEERSHKGDATFETENWYQDSLWFALAGSAFFYRGGQFGGVYPTSAGVFSLSGFSGHSVTSHSGRPVLVFVS